jgi:anaerobic C4-dicarboxylate transporter
MKMMIYNDDDMMMTLRIRMRRMMAGMEVVVILMEKIEREKISDREEREGKRAGMRACVCVCECMRER